MFAPDQSVRWSETFAGWHWPPLPVRALDCDLIAGWQCAAPRTITPTMFAVDTHTHARQAGDASGPGRHFTRALPAYRSDPHHNPSQSLCVSITINGYISARTPLRTRRAADRPPGRIFLFARRNRTIRTVRFIYADRLATRPLR